MQVDALLSETDLTQEEVTAYEETVSTLSELLLQLPDMQVSSYCQVHHDMPLPCQVYGISANLLAAGAVHANEVTVMQRPAGGPSPSSSIPCMSWHF